jgi:AraC-like DNA-binding protein
MKLLIRSAYPDSSISHYVHSFWMLQNNTGKDLHTTLLPNGMVDVNLMKLGSGDWKMIVRGVDTMPGEVTIKAGSKMFAVGLKLLAVEYLLGDPIKDVLNHGKELATDFWKFEEKDMKSLSAFCKKVTKIITGVSSATIDNRKLELFELLYSSKGSISVKELSAKVYWSSRQINRYFNQQFGISLKAYCSILRFSESFQHISEGKLFPELNFTDQNHFIKVTKKYAGVTPKELSKNNNDRFIDITVKKRLTAND